MMYNLINFICSFFQQAITELLKKTAKGKAVLKHFQLFGLDKPSRLTIAECVIQDEYGADTNKVISCDRFTTLARLIEVFSWRV